MNYRNRHKRKKFNKIYFIICAVFIYILIPTQEISYTLNISQGKNLKAIANELKENEIINSKTLFLYKARKSNFDTKIQVGDFEISSKDNNLEILNKISQTAKEQNRITIPEGYTIKQIEEKLNYPAILECLKSNCNQETISDIAPETLQNGLEGFLFPETYNFQLEQKEQLINKMSNQFIKVLPKDYIEKIQKLPINSLYEAIIVASMLEKEVITPKDKSIAAGIIYKRLKNNWTLGIDATLLYLKNNREITIQDLKDDNPYNTRRNLGLPPTPICNPGLESIIAALNPIETEYWFYLTKPVTNEVVYGRNNQEHEANKNKYLR